MGDEVRIALQPGLHLGMFVGAVVVHHQVQWHRAGKFSIQTAQEAQKLLVPVPLKALANDPSLQHL